VPETAMAKDLAARFRVAPGDRAHLGRRNPADIAAFPNRDEAEAQTARDVAEIDRLQDRLYAEGRRALLVVLQGVDTAGKDGTIRAVFKETSPLGVLVTPFRQPSEQELAHDFLWRAHRACPARGYIGIFNRSHYEECLVVRVHPEILAKQKLPPELVTRDIWRERFEDISCFERHLARNGTVVLKFFLNVSKQEQRERFLERLEQPSKNWKFSMGDVAERKLWAKYQAAYQDMIRHTATRHAPWHVVPADHKWFARVVIGSAIVAALDKLDLHFPKVNKEDRSEFRQVRQALLDEDRKAAAKGK
jgi:PPK2 family polyphosphate:nucleotide phosphotransferase